MTFIVHIEKNADNDSDNDRIREKENEHEHVNDFESENYEDDEL